MIQEAIIWTIWGIPFWLFPVIIALKIVEYGLYTVRIQFVIHGHPVKAALLLALETFVWIFALTWIFHLLERWPWLALVYATGAGVGSYLGTTVGPWVRQMEGSIYDEEHEHQEHHESS